VGEGELTVKVGSATEAVDDSATEEAVDSSLRTFWASSAQAPLARAAAAQAMVAALNFMVKAGGADVMYVRERWEALPTAKLVLLRRQRTGQDTLGLVQLPILM
jgi:hypothetical protein